jgi:hypothetical protein
MTLPLVQHWFGLRNGGILALATASLAGWDRGRLRWSRYRRGRSSPMQRSIAASPFSFGSIAHATLIYLQRASNDSALIPRQNAIRRLSYFPVDVQ